LRLRNVALIFSPFAMPKNIDFKCNNVALKIGVKRLV